MANVGRRRTYYSLYAFNAQISSISADIFASEAPGRRHQTFAKFANGELRIKKPHRRYALKAREIINAVIAPKNRISAAPNGYFGGVSNRVSADASISLNS